MESEETIKSTLIDCLHQQICELEVLTSIYPNNGDIVYTNKAVLDNIKEFVDNKTQYTPNHLDFTLNLSIENLKLEISVNLPSLYPKKEPIIFIRCNQFNRQEETSLNCDLSNYIRDNHYGEQCLYTAISWIQDNVEKHNCKIKENKISASDFKNIIKVELKFVRLWVFSHHIYNKKKREEIMKIAKENNLTGFSFPGKPGIVCIEGYEDNCTNWWKIIKTLSWKKINIRKTEIFEESERSKQQKFNNFEEISFHKSSKSCNHSDMSAFLKYIGDHGLSYIINDLFKLSCT